MNNIKICLKINKCKLCEKEYTHLQELQKHIDRAHKNEITKEEYYNKYLHIMPNICPVCGELTEFKSFVFGYKILCNKRSCNVAYTNPTLLSSYIYHGYTEEEAKLKLSEYQSNQAKKVNRTDEYFDKCFKNRVGYWLNKGYTKDLAIQKVTEYQNKISLNAFIERYGDNGIKHFNERIEKCRKTYYSKSDEERAIINKSRGRTNEQLIELYGKERALQIIKQRCLSDKRHMYSSSKAELELFNKLKPYFPDAISQFKLYSENKLYIYDINIGNIIIEYNGTYWHGDPRFYKSSDMLSNYTAKTKWDLDKNKREYAENSGYRVIYIWEYDYLNNKNQVTDNLIKEIYAFKNN